MRNIARSALLAFCLAVVAIGMAAASPLNRKISGNLPDYADLHPYQGVTISPDSRYAVYASDERVDEYYEIYSTRLDGSSRPVRLSGPTQSPMNSTTLDWKITPDGKRVVYRSNESVLGAAQLFSIPIEGGQKTRLSPPSPQYAYDYVISPDSSRVVVSTEDGTFSVPVEGGEATQLAPVSIYGFEITADSRTVLYAQDGLISVPISGGAAITLSNELRLRGGWQEYADGAGVQRVAFIAANDTGVYGLYTVPATGGEVEQVLPAFGGPSVEFSICSMGEWAVFQTGQTPGEQVISSVSLSARETLTLTVDAGSPEFGGKAFAISPDCSSVVYHAGDSLFVVPVTGGSPTRVSYFCYRIFTFSPDSKHMVYMGRESLNQRCEVRALDLTTNSSTQVNPPLAPGGRVMVWPHLITPDSQHVLYVAEQESSNVAELFMASFDGAENKKLSGPMTFGGNVTSSPVLSPDGRYVVYRADQEQDEVHELFVTVLGDEAGARTYLPLVQR